MKTQKQMLAAVTRSQTQRQTGPSEMSEAELHAKGEMSEGEPDADDEKFDTDSEEIQQEGNKEDNPGFGFAEDLFMETRDPRPKMTRSQKRANGITRTRREQLTENVSLSQAQAMDTDVRK